MRALTKTAFVYSGVGKRPGGRYGERRYWKREREMLPRIVAGHDQVPRRGGGGPDNIIKDR